MESKEKSVDRSVYITLGATILVAVISIAVGVSIKMDLSQTIIFAMNNEVLVFALEIYISVRTKERTREVDIISGEGSVFRKAFDLEARAEREIYAMWCVMQYGPRLEEYFREFKGSRYVLRRLINVKNAGSKNVREHLSEFISELKSGDYVVTSTDHGTYECLIADRARALFLCPHHVTGALHLGLYSENDHFVSTMITTFERFETIGKKLVIPSDADDSTAKKIIGQWIKSVM